MDDVVSPELHNSQIPLELLRESPLSQNSERYSFPSPGTEGGRVFLAIELNPRSGVTKESVQTIIRKINDLKPNEYLQTATAWRDDKSRSQNEQPKDFPSISAVATALENLPTSRSKTMADIQKIDRGENSYTYESNIRFVNTGIKRGGLVLTVKKFVEHTVASDSRVPNGEEIRNIQDLAKKKTPVQRNVVDFEWTSEKYASDIIEGLRQVDPHQATIEPKS